MIDDWCTLPAGKVARISIGGTPAREVGAFWSDREGGHPWVSIADMKSHSIFETAEYISDLGVASSNVKLVPAGTPIMSFKLTIGKTSVALRDLYTNEAIAAFDCDLSVVNPRFLFHALPSSAARVVTDVAIKGATLNKKSLSSMPLLLPPLREQRRIAAILDALDEQIIATELIISKLKQFRSGLLLDLIDRGDNGVRWEPLAAVARVTVGYVGPTNPFYTSSDGGVLFLRTGNIGSGRILLDNCRWVTESFHRSQAKSGLHAGDVVVSRVGYTGTAAVVPELGEVNCANMIIIRAGGDVRPDWVRLLFESETYRRQVIGFTAGSAQPVLNIGLVEQLKTPVPSCQRQDRIIAAIAEHDVRQESEIGLCAKLRCEKLGLLSDLLSGRVRLPREVAA